MSTSYGPQLARFQKMVSEAKGKLSKRAFVRDVERRHGIRRSRAIDPSEYPKIKGMEGPYRYKNGHVLYYDPREGAYYDRNGDRYLSDLEATSLTMSREPNEPTARDSDLAKFNRLVEKLSGYGHDEALFQQWLDHVRSTMTKAHPDPVNAMKLEVMKGRKYWRIVKVGKGTMNRSSYGFYNPATGDLLKADGWKRPAKGPRGNIHDRSTWKRSGPYSVS